MTYLSRAMILIWGLSNILARSPLTLPDGQNSTQGPELERRQCPLICDQYGYMIASTILYRVDVNSGNVTKIKSPVGDGSNVNAMGYNPLDNYLYAWQSGHNWIIRMAGDGTATNITQLTFNNSPNMADFDDKGHYWYCSAGKTYGVIDLAPGSSTFGQLLQNGSITNSTYGYSVGDWCFVPETGRYMWTVGYNANTTTLATLRFNMNTTVFEVVNEYTPFNATIFGAVYGINNGTIFASDNTYGNVYGFRLNETTAPWLSTVINKTSSNDGARCVYNLLGS